MLTTGEVAILRHVASVLLPGDEKSPAASDIAELDQLIGTAASALGREVVALKLALECLSGDVSWASLRSFAETHPDHFEIVSAVAAGAYFMAPAALSAIGYPQGGRKAPRIDQAADELSSGVLDLVAARESMLRDVPA
jgi:hypothetical protein